MIRLWASSPRIRSVFGYRHFGADCRFLAAPLFLWRFQLASLALNVRRISWSYPPCSSCWRGYGTLWSLWKSSLLVLQPLLPWTYLWRSILSRRVRSRCLQRITRGVTLKKREEVSKSSKRDSYHGSSVATLGLFASGVWRIVNPVSATARCLFSGRSVGVDRGFVWVLLIFLFARKGIVWMQCLVRQRRRFGILS